MLVYLCLLSLILCNFGISSKGIPSYITLCKRNDPELDKCILRAVEQIKPHLKKGIPELGIPSLDPLVVPYAGVSTGPDFNATFENIEVYNVYEFDLKKFAVDLDKIELDIELSIPNLRTKSKYSVNGKILFLELKGSGPSEGNFTNIRAFVTGKGKKVERQGKSYIEINEVKVDANYGKPVLMFSELFENKEVTEQTNKVINDNIESLIEELKPVINQVVTEVVQNLSSRVFSKFSFDELFPM
ncbi:hypothetical protein WA026_000747 [Henosepilachna vigintioctopunctata]|uniref:Uncharacterized protein n=1 Tax=Henosepilachna vigintioctopunctata TaxID=420089 RepID=A0AAW1V8G0_9CUCU